MDNTVKALKKLQKNIESNIKDFEGKDETFIIVRLVLRTIRNSITETIIELTQGELEDGKD